MNRKCGFGLLSFQDTDSLASSGAHCTFFARATAIKANPYSNGPEGGYLCVAHAPIEPWVDSHKLHQETSDAA